MTTSTPIDVEQLRDVVCRTAQFGNGTVTIGTYEGGGDVSLLLVDGDRTRPTVIAGSTGSGGTELIESLRDGTESTGIHVDFADTQHMRAAQAIRDCHAEILDRNRYLAEHGERTGVGVLPLRLLLVDDLAEVDHETAGLLTQVVQMAPKTNIAVVVRTQHLGADIPGGALLYETLKAGNVVELRTFRNGIPRTFEDGSSTAGVGYVNGDLFRVWYPGH
ncbi:hypothetical protein AB0F72_08890 [Actinoplanes sp. NPDC023936]|uniref:hypothetical protein n=1 Tax=Actinoplanes sp. NPDC023936 TaxID=3154910 RepID=UPI0033F8E664